MHSSRVFIFLLSLSLVACSSAPVKDSTVNIISPAQAIMAAAEIAPDSVSGVFELHIQSTGRQRGVIYLNSETDYRDQRCLTLAINPIVARGFIQKYGEEPDIYLKNKMIRVSGEARRVKIWFYSKGKRTEKYYYQTHVFVTNESQVEVL